LLFKRFPFSESIVISSIFSWVLKEYLLSFKGVAEQSSALLWSFELSNSKRKAN